MSDLQKYQKYRLQRESSGSKVLKFFLWLILILVLIWIFKGCFGGTKQENANTANNNINISSNSNGNNNFNVNENTNASANANVSIPVSAKSFNLDNCTSVFSRGQNRKEVSLTFNGASKTDNLDQIIDILKSSNVPASFFLTGEVIEKNNDKVSNLVNQGFPIYNLSYDYAHVANLSADELSTELEKTDKAAQAAANTTTKPFFRPPYGETGGKVFDAALAEGYCPVTWTVDAFDWDTEQTAEGAKTRVLNNLKGGSIIVMQVGTSLVPQFLQDLINEIKNKGYSIVDLPTLLTP